MVKFTYYATYKLQEFRDTKEWTRQQMAGFLTLKLGKPVSSSTIEKWEKQERAIDAVTALDMSKAMKITVTELVTQKTVVNG